MATTFAEQIAKEIAEGQRCCDCDHFIGGSPLVPKPRSCWQCQEAKTKAGAVVHDRMARCPWCGNLERPTIRYEEYTDEIECATCGEEYTFSVKPSAVEITSQPMLGERRKHVSGQ